MPCPAIVVDAQGLVVAANERFSEATGVAHTFLLGHEWWQGFASDSASDAEHAQREIATAVGANGVLRTPLMQADRIAVQVHLSWQRMTEPGTNREVWVLAFFGWYPLESVSTASLAWPLLLHTPSVAGFSSALAAELEGLVARSRGADAGALGAELGDVVRGLRDIGRIEGGSEEFSATAILWAALDAFYEASGRSPVRVVETARGRARRRPADPVRWITALIAFARERTPEPEPLDISVFDEPGFLCVSVRDRGGALPAESFAALAESPFSTDPAAAGTGPLRWVRALARSCGGSLRVTNDAEGVTATLSFPAIDAG